MGTAMYITRNEIYAEYRSPLATEGDDGDAWFDFDSFGIYIKRGGQWEKKVSMDALKGAKGDRGDSGIQGLKGDCCADATLKAVALTIALALAAFYLIGRFMG